MNKQRSRIVKYADLRRKIENMSYFDLNSEKDKKSLYYEPDNFPKPKSTPVIKHNTLTVPLAELLKEAKKHDYNSISSTQELKSTDEPVKPTKKERGKNKFFESVTDAFHSAGPLYKNWIFWAILIATVVIIAMIICISLLV